MGGSGSGTKGVGTRPWHSAFMKGKRLALKHGHTQQGSKVSPTYSTWRATLSRCNNTKHREYRHYGAKGIVVCVRWHVFDNFLADMGERPTGTSLDRFPNRNGNYEPGNCRWATATEQQRNRDVVKLTVDLANEIMGRLEHGEKEEAVAARIGVSRGTVNAVRRGKIWRELSPFHKPQLAKHPRFAIADLVACVKCGAAIGQPCTYAGNHNVRLQDAARISVTGGASAQP